MKPVQRTTAIVAVAGLVLAATALGGCWGSKNRTPATGAGSSALTVSSTADPSAGVSGSADPSAAAVASKKKSSAGGSPGGTSGVGSKGKTSSGSSTSAKAAAETKALDSELQAIEAELGKMDLPADSDFSGITVP